MDRFNKKNEKQYVHFEPNSTEHWSGNALEVYHKRLLRYKELEEYASNCLMLGNFVFLHLA
jgi:hypothetical protein